MLPYIRTFLSKLLFPSKQLQPLRPPAESPETFQITVPSSRNEASEVEQINFSITKSILLSFCFQLSGGGRGLCLRRGGLHRGADSGGSRGEWPGRCQEGSHGGDNSFTVEDGGAGLARCGWMMRDLAWSSRFLLVRKWLLNALLSEQLHHFG